MISKRVMGRKDGKSSASDSLRYGEGLTVDRSTGEILDKSHRTRFGNFGLVDDGVYVAQDVSVMEKHVRFASVEMQNNCDLNRKVGKQNKIAHFVISYNQEKPSEAVLRDTEDSMLAALKLEKNHFASFLHNDNGYWHLHLFVSRIEKAEPHRGNDLWHDKIIRDKVCREIEIRHGLQRDNGLHRISDAGQIIEIPFAERKAKREQKVTISDKSQTTEKYSGEKTFQSWCNEIRIGDRLKPAKSWTDLHLAAAAYRCEIKPKGAGFVICPIGEKGGIQLSKIGLKNLPAKFGPYQAAEQGVQIQPIARYAGESVKPSGDLYQKWKLAKDAFKVSKTAAHNEIREKQRKERAAIKEQQRNELQDIRASDGKGRSNAVSIAKLKHAVELTDLSSAHALERRQQRELNAMISPGVNFKDYLSKQAASGNEQALSVLRKYSSDKSTPVAVNNEADKLEIVASATGRDNYQVPRLKFTHTIEKNGSVIFDLGLGRKIIDSALTKEIQLNTQAAKDAAAVEASLRFASAKFGGTLTLNGSDEFKRFAAETAVQKGLNIKFSDPSIEAYRNQLLNEQRNKFKPQPHKENQHVSTTQRNHTNKRAGQVPPAKLRNRLRHLSDGDMVLDTSRDVGLLQRHVSDRVEQQQTRSDHQLQRTAERASSAGSTTGQSVISLREKYPTAAAPINARRYIGKVVDVTENEVAQDCGRGKEIVIHQRVNFPTQNPVVGQMYDFTHREHEAKKREAARDLKQAKNVENRPTEGAAEKQKNKGNDFEI